MNKNVVIVGGIIVAALVLGGGAYAWKKNQTAGTAQKTAETPKKKKITDPVNVIAVDQRPYIEISPKDTRNITIAIKELKKPATSADYELEYQTETNLEGAVGTLDVGQLPALKEILLGSCSAGGACRYHEGVKGGTFLIKFGGAENYALKQEWKYIINTAKESALSSKDAKFQIDSKALAKQSIVIIYNSPGYPKTPGQVISETYVLSTLSPVKDKAKLTIRTNEEASSVAVMGWNGTSWQEFAAKADGKTVTADVDLMTAYVVVKK